MRVCCEICKAKIRGKRVLAIGRLMSHRCNIKGHKVRYPVRLQMSQSHYHLALIGGGDKPTVHTRNRGLGCGIRYHPNSGDPHAPLSWPHSARSLGPLS